MTRLPRTTRNARSSTKNWLVETTTHQTVKVEHDFDKAAKQIAKFEKMLKYVTSDQAALTQEVYQLRDAMHAIDLALNGSAARAEVGEKDHLSVGSRLYFAASGLMDNSYGQTQLHVESYEMAKAMLEQLEGDIADLANVQVPALAKKLEAAGAPIILD